MGFSISPLRLKGKWPERFPTKASISINRGALNIEFQA